MKIYASEIEDGVADLIKTQACVSYASFVEPCENKSSFNFQDIKTIASLDDSDLYYVQSILVTSSWNKNDDIFDKAEVWNAKNTPEDKPTNLEHDEGLIIGHITSNYPVTDDGELIDPNTPIDQLPDKFHILTGSVIYRGFTKPELKDRSNKLIAEIEQGTKYVSMECFFRGFDYGIIDKTTGQYKVLSRNDDTSHLTKYLRAYGGKGEHNNYKIGRVLRDITFSGKGFVDKPANIDSIIFSRSELMYKFLEEKNEDLEKEGVIDNKPIFVSENNTMSSENTSVENTNNEALESKVAELESVVSTHITEKETLMQEKEALVKETQTLAETHAAELEAIKAELDKANQELAAYKSKEEEMKKKEMKMKRMAELVETGLDTTEASETLESMDAFSDEQFELVLAAMKKMKQAKKMMASTEVETESTKESIADASTLDTVEVEPEVNLAISEEEDTSAIEATRASLIDFVKSRLQITK